MHADGLSWMNRFENLNCKPANKPHRATSSVKQEIVHIPTGCEYTWAVVETASERAGESVEWMWPNVKNVSWILNNKTHAFLTRVLRQLHKYCALLLWSHVAGYKTVLLPVININTAHTHVCLVPFFAAAPKWHVMRPSLLLASHSHPLKNIITMNLREWEPFLSFFVLQHFSISLSFQRKICLVSFPLPLAGYILLK